MNVLLKQGFLNMLELGTHYRGKKCLRTPFIFITVTEHKVNV